jgi:hypothetical protein
MKEIITKTVVTQENSAVPRVNSQDGPDVSRLQTSEYVIFFLLGTLEILLAARLLLKLTGANPVSSFVSLIYGITQLFIMPFEGIFRRAVTQGVETTAVLEPATIVAMIVYAVLVWGLVKLMYIVLGKHQPA